MVLGQGPLGDAPTIATDSAQSKILARDRLSISKFGFITALYITARLAMQAIDPGVRSGDRSLMLTTARESLRNL